MFFSLGRQAWTETHWHSQTNTLAAAVDDTTTLATTRVGLLGKQSVLTGIRLSFDGVYRDSLLIDPAAIPVPKGQLAISAPANPQAPAVDTLSSDTPNVDIVIRMEGGERRRRTCYLGGNPDAVVTGPFLPKGIDPSVAWWSKNLVKWQAIMTSGVWGFMARNIDPPVGVVKGFQGNAVPPTMMGIIVGNGTMGPVPFNPQIQLRNFQVQPGAPKINGKYWVSGDPTAIDGNQLWMLLDSLNLVENNVVKAGTAEFVQWTWQKYTSADVEYAHTRKRGGRSGLPLGRVKRRK